MCPGQLPRTTRMESIPGFAVSTRPGSSHWFAPAPVRRSPAIDRRAQTDFMETTLPVRTPPYPVGRPSLPRGTSRRQPYLLSGGLCCWLPWQFAELIRRSTRALPGKNVNRQRHAPCRSIPTSGLPSPQPACSWVVHAYARMGSYTHARTHAPKQLPAVITWPCNPPWGHVPALRKREFHCTMHACVCGCMRACVRV